MVAAGVMSVHGYHTHGFMKLYMEYLRYMFLIPAAAVI